MKQGMEAIEAATSVVIVTGVSGAGKSTVGELLAKELGWPYAEADRFHPASNVAKMSAGKPLDDADRAPWLAAIAEFIEDIRGRGEHAVVTCSGLKRAYRETIAGSHAATLPAVRVVFLDGDRDTIARRLRTRTDHFMPPALLASQFAALEKPAADEPAISVPITGTPGDTVARILEALRAAG